MVRKIGPGFLLLPAFAASACATQADALARAGLQADASRPAVQVNLLGDERPETIQVASIAALDRGATFANPWAEANAPGEPMSPPRRGEQVLAVSAPDGRVWALRDAVYERLVALRSGESAPSDIADCRADATQNAIYVGREGVGGIIAWDDTRFTWRQCGD